MSFSRHKFPVFRKPCRPKRNPGAAATLLFRPRSCTTAFRKSFSSQIRCRNCWRARRIPIPVTHVYTADTTRQTYGRRITYFTLYTIYVLRYTAMITAVIDCARVVAVGHGRAKNVRTTIVAVYVFKSPATSQSLYHSLLDATEIQYRRTNGRQRSRSGCEYDTGRHDIGWPRTQDARARCLSFVR